MRSAMCAARQLPGRGLTDVDDGPAPTTELKKNLIYMIMIIAWLFSLVCPSQCFNFLMMN